MWKIYIVFSDDKEPLSEKRKYFSQGKEYPEPEIKRICQKGCDCSAV